MLRRICITLLETEAPGREVVAVAWPWSNSPRDLTPELAHAVSMAVGGLPVVLLATTPEGVHSFGRREHTVAAATLDFPSVRWNLIDVEDGRVWAGAEAA